jgi:phosphoesterase RecJ-like protein
VVLDASDSIRTGDKATVEAWSESGKLAVIDHHPGGDLARLTRGIGFQNTEVSSTCELVYHIGAALGVKFTGQVSTALLTGIYTDTGGFHHSNTRPSTLAIASELMRRGGSLRTIVREVGEHRTLGQLRLIGVGMERLSPLVGGRIITTAVTQEDVSNVQADEDDLSGITGPLTEVDGAELCMVLCESEPGVVRGSLRTAARGLGLTPRALALALGGGGHVRASGFRISGRLIQKTYTDGSHGWQIVSNSATLDSVTGAPR